MKKVYNTLTPDQKAFVTKLDALESAELKIAELEKIIAGDVDGDGKITVSDVVALRKAIMSG